MLSFKTIGRSVLSQTKRKGYLHTRLLMKVSSPQILVLNQHRTPVLNEQRRHFFRFLVTQRLNKLETIANANPSDPAAQAQFLKKLVEYYPDAVVRRVELGQYAVNEEVVKLYLRALVHAGKIEEASLGSVFNQLKGQGFQGLPLGQATATPLAGVAGEVLGEQPAGLAAPVQEHITKFQEKAAQSGGLYVGKKSVPVESLAAAGGSGRIAAAGEGPMGPLAAGLSSQEPLHVVLAEAGWKSQAWRTARTLTLAFLVVSAIGAILDEQKGGLSSRLLGTSKQITNIVETSDKRFDDVCGVDEAKAELEEIVMYLKNPKKFTRLGGWLPKGMMLVGPPGTGKTLLARAIAGEAGVPFFYCSGSEFEEMYVGVGARRVRDLFELAKKHAPCIIFIDEIDAVGGSRHLKEQQAMKMTLNQLLVEMDGFKQNNGIIVIGATNFPDVLDSALTRPGRFDKHIQVPLPDVGGRKAILEHYCKAIELDPKTDLDILARGTPGMSGAELYNLINQAALKASVDGLQAVDQAALDYAKDKILMGAERESAYISPETARMTAYHEGGHALVALMTEGADPIHKATIMPRGRALGMVQQLPEGDQTSRTRKQMVADLDVCMGGRVAEELVYGESEVTSGASSDIQQATRLAKAMVMYYGMCDEVGPMFHEDPEKISPELKAQIDREIRKLLDESYARAKGLLTKHRGKLDSIAKALIKYETLTGEEVKQVMNGRKLKKQTKEAKQTALKK
mmetsp:Transcript_3255/g.4592  ORF Transcript_3255/g.4592 Transcript_3255/m.4592 type:complete len:739 (+) Transcript_3255:53-2269(+)